jgi:hypothetical protein
MPYAIAADAVLIIHLAFIIVVVLGGLMWRFWRYAPLVHLPMAAWGVLVEVRGWYCPLTTLENDLLRAAGNAGYDGSFVGHYLLAMLYPAGLTRDVQLLLAAFVVIVNLLVYAWVWWRRKRDSHSGASGHDQSGFHRR